MNALCLASAAAAAFALLAGCDGTAPNAGATQPIAAPPATVLPDSKAAETVASADPQRDEAPDAPKRRRGGGAFGVGIRPTGSSANGITP